MKRIFNKTMLCFLPAIVAGSLACHAQNKDTFILKGTLKNISPMPAKIYLSESPAGVLEKGSDSTAVQNGEYQFTGNINGAAGVIISTNSKGIVKNQDESTVVILDKGEIDVVSDGKISNVTITGSGTTAQQQWGEIRKNTIKESEEVKRLASAADFKTNKELQGQVSQRSGKLIGQIVMDMYYYVKAHPSAAISPYATLVLFNLGITATAKDTLLRTLPASAKLTNAGLAIAKTIEKQDKLLQEALVKQEAGMSQIALGSKAPDFTENNTKGNPVSLSSLKGKYVLIDFWASWCKPCREENPNVVKNYKAYKDKGFTVLGVSLDNQAAKGSWMKAIEMDGLIWTQVSDLKGWDNGAAKLYDVHSIPQNFLIDPNGNVIGKNLRGQALSDKLATLFK